MSEQAWYWLKVGHKMIEITRCPSCGEAVQQSGPCDVCFQAVWLEWLARKSLTKEPEAKKVAVCVDFYQSSWYIVGRKDGDAYRTYILGPSFTSHCGCALDARSLPITCKHGWSFTEEVPETYD